MKTIKIGNRIIGQEASVFIIAEAGVNHNGDIELARQLISAAKDAGADAVKFQTFRAEKLATAQAEKAAYQRRNSPEQEDQLSMLKKLELPKQAFGELKEYADSAGIVFLSTPFDEESADLLDQIGVDAYKISSGDLTNLPFLGFIARKGKPVIVSTGMAYLDEVSEAVNCIINNGNTQIALLHCTSNYPPELTDANLLAIRTLAETFDFPVGYSDHTPGDTAAVVATALGSVILEKHITLDCSLPGPDHRASIEPESFREMVGKIREVEVMMGTGKKAPVPAEEEIRRVARKSIVAGVNIEKGTNITGGMLAVKRPGTGISPKGLNLVIGCTAARAIAKDEIITPECLEGYVT